jgi:hypothetical protein
MQTARPVTVRSSQKLFDCAKAKHYLQHLLTNTALPMMRLIPLLTKSNTTNWLHRAPHGPSFLVAIQLTLTANQPISKTYNQPNRIIRFNNCMQCFSCVLNIAAIFIEELQDAADCIDIIASLVYCATSGCMVAQMNYEMTHVNNEPIQGGAPEVLTMTRD